MRLKSDNALDGLLELHSLLVEQVGKYKKTADDIFPKVMEVGKWPHINSYVIASGYSLGSYSFFKYKCHYNGETDISNEADLVVRKEKITQVIEQLEKDIIACEEANKEAIQNNTKVREKVGLVMTHLGIKPTYQEYETPKGCRTKKWVTKTSGYVCDLGRNVPVSISGIKPNIAELKRKLEQEYSQSIQKVRIEEQKKAKVKKEAEDVHKIALLRAKYCPDNAFADSNDILEVLLSKDKYLRLAYWLEKNRGDWSEGYNFGEIGIDGFSVEDDTDDKIFTEIHELVYGERDYTDGRCFRDCTWNYGVLYGMVKDQSLLG